MLDLILRGGTLVDGSGAPRRRADVGIQGDRIAAVGQLADDVAAREVDINGLTVAPGFVDLHAHSDLSLLSDGRARSKIHQGVTTEVVGNCGLSPFPAPAERAAEVRRAVAIVDLDAAVPMTWNTVRGYRDVLGGSGTAVNVVVLAGHVALRVAIAGDAPGVLSDADLARLADGADAALEGGAVGLSTGLMYPPARFADGRELEVLGHAVARHDAILAAHMRDYGPQLLDAVEEVVAVARVTGCRLQISHLAVAGRRNWGSVRRALDIVDAAIADGLDIGVDIYPYLAGSANLSQLLPGWAQEGGSDVVAGRLHDASVRSRIREDWTESLQLGWDEVFVSLVDPELEAVALGKSVEEVARAWDTDADDAALELIARTADRVQMVAFGRSDDDLDAVLRHDAAAIGSDGFSLDPDGPTGLGRPHPRSYGCYPRLLGKYVREEGVLTLERAVAMSTSVPAARLAIGDRGLVREGAFADLVVFDADRIIDRATFEDPATFPDGIVHVLVNGTAVIVDGAEQTVDPLPGHVVVRDRARNSQDQHQDHHKETA